VDEGPQNGRLAGNYYGLAWLWKKGLVSPVLLVLLVLVVLAVTMAANNYVITDTHKLFKGRQVNTLFSPTSIHEQWKCVAMGNLWTAFSHLFSVVSGQRSEWGTQGMAPK